MLAEGGSGSLRPTAEFYRAYGWTWQSDLSLELFQLLSSEIAVPDIQVSLHSGEQPPEREALFSNGRASISVEGFRFRDGEIATMDVVGGKEIAVYPGVEWKGSLPQSFFSTVAGALLALRGGLPIHGSAVEIDGEAIILCGPSGAGKSTLTAALIANGARLISDDLSLIRHTGPGEVPALYSGRRSIRLFAGTAVALREAVASDTIAASGPKELVVPPAVKADEGVPLAGFILLNADPVGRKVLKPLGERLAELWFRPKIYACIPGHTFRAKALLSVLERSRFVSAPRVTVSSSVDLKALSQGLMEIWQNED